MAEGAKTLWIENRINQDRGGATGQCAPAMIYIANPLLMLAFLLLYVPREKLYVPYMNCPEGLTRPISGTAIPVAADTGEI